jgi:NAD(P)-dependent dehydrogenase (short-subunit alcohol dehydrogenase family)
LCAYQQNVGRPPRATFIFIWNEQLSTKLCCCKSVMTGCLDARESVSLPARNVLNVECSAGARTSNSASRERHCEEQRGAVHGPKALPLMPEGASIILNASVVSSKGLSSNSVYSATKAAIRSFARTRTTDLKNRRIRVNAISPGPLTRLAGSLVCISTTHYSGRT